MKNEPVPPYEQSDLRNLLQVVYLDTFCLAEGQAIDVEETRARYLEAIELFARTPLPLDDRCRLGAMLDECAPVLGFPTMDPRAPDLYLVCSCGRELGDHEAGADSCKPPAESGILPLAARIVAEADL